MNEWSVLTFLGVLKENMQVFSLIHENVISVFCILDSLVFGIFSTLNATTKPKRKTNLINKALEEEV